MSVLRAAALRGFPALVRQLGGDPDALLDAAHIAPSLLDEESAYISHRAAVHLLERAASLLNSPDFGLRLSQQQDLAVLGPLAVAMRHSPTLGEALARVAKHLHIHSPSLRFSATSKGQGCTLLSIEVLLDRLTRLDQTIDLSLGLSHRNMLLLTGGRYQPLAVHFAHARLAPLSAYEQHFGTDVRFEQPFSGIILSDSMLDLPLTGSNRELEQIIADYFDFQFAPPSSGLAPQVQQLVLRLLQAGRCTLEDTATALGMQPRTLQRRLAGEQTTFDAIKDAVRQDLAKQYVEETGMPLSQIALILGYSELSALTRSYRRWFGASPQQQRTAGRNQPRGTAAAVPRAP